MTSADDPGAGAPQDRLREHPTARFAPAQHVFDLRAAARELEREIPASRGRRQKTLYRHGDATIALFTFERGAGLPGHRARGTVAIQALEGRLRIATPDGEHTLAAGSLLVLASGVEHDVLAEEPSIMLLQVHLDEPARGESR
jgi:quercetin dioxygenase-like cupin family protein